MIMAKGITRAEFTNLQQQVESLRALLQEQQILSESTYATRGYVQTYVEHMLGELMPADTLYTENSEIVGYVPVDIERLLKHFTNLGGTYNLWDYRVILTNYDGTCRDTDIDPYLLIAQMVKETDWCRSWWSQRPRRNPAGIGVTGETSKTAPETNKEAWAFNGEVWVKGYSFPSWQISSEAHAGHMCAYLYKNDELTAPQAYCLGVDPRAKFIPEKWRGSVTTLKDLDGKWAFPGIGYGRSIATIANVLKR